MDMEASFVTTEDGALALRKGTGGTYKGGLRPGDMLDSLFSVVPELREIAALDLKIPFNKDSCRVGPREWVEIARTLDRSRHDYDAFLVVHGTGEGLAGRG